VLGGMPSMEQVVLQQFRGSVFNNVSKLYASVPPLISGENFVT